jgi:phospholipase C
MGHRRTDAPRGRPGKAALGTRLAAAAAVAALAIVLATSMSASASSHRLSTDSTKAVKVAASDGLGLTPGKIKHVWLIILENKSYDASFSGLNNNTYLWKTCRPRACS